jgi:hypothetical protein
MFPADDVVVEVTEAEDNEVIVDIVTPAGAIQLMGRFASKVGSFISQMPISKVCVRARSAVKA